MYENLRFWDDNYDLKKPTSVSGKSSFQHRQLIR